MDNEHENRPSWEYVNPIILGNLFKAEQYYSVWFNKVKYSKADPKTCQEYFFWNDHFCQLYLNLKAHLLERGGETYKELHDDMEKFLSGSLELDDGKKRRYLFSLISFVKILGLTSVEIEKSARTSLVHRK
jgi:hypothetical protein